MLTGSTLDVLVGHYVDAIRLSDDSTLIEFVCGDTSFLFRAEGDCCSESWFNHFAGVDLVRGHTVTQIIEREETEADGTRQEYDTVYGWTLVTDAGYADLELRNSNNGYYGGWVTFIGHAEWYIGDNTKRPEVQEDF